MMCWPSGVTARSYTTPVCPSKVWTSVPSTWYSRSSPPLRPTTKCSPSGIATERTSPSKSVVGIQVHAERALEHAVERPQLRGLVVRAADEARSARQHRRAVDVVLILVRVDGALARAVAPHLDRVVARVGGNTPVAARQHARRRARDRRRQASPRRCAAAWRELRSVGERVARRERDVVGERQLVEHEAQHVRRQLEEHALRRRAPRRAGCWHAAVAARVATSAATSSRP